MKSPRKKAVDYADKWYSLYIRERTKMEYGKCPFCGGAIEHCFHFFSRANYATRWDEINGIGSCSGCNMRMEFSPYQFYKWFVDNLGQFTLDQLHLKHNTIGKFSTHEILAIGDKFKKMYEDIKQ